jgi:gamma-glutamylputrescine oxidase
MRQLPNNSYYTASAGAFPIASKLRGEERADVCVVGGGFTGLSAALNCAERGLSVVLLEAEFIGFGASGRNGGQMIPGFNMYGSDLVKLIGRERGEALYRLANAAQRSVHARIARHNIECDLRKGHVHLAAKRGDYADFADETEFAVRTLGKDHAVLVPPDRVRDYVGVDGYHGAVYIADGGHFHPLKYARGLAQACLDAGVKLFENSRVERVDDGAQVTVRTATGTVTARHAILACDSEMADLNSTAGGKTMPVLNYIIATEPLGEAKAAELIPSGAAVSDSRFVLNYFRLSADNRMLFAGGEKYSPRPPRDIAAFVRPYMLKLFPSLAGAAIDYAWGGTVGITVNRLPHFGRQGNLYFAHGYSGQGVLLTTLAGELIAEALCGTAERFDLFAQIPHHSFPGGRFLRSPIYVAAMLYSALRDRL